jgi:erythromycin esterase
MTHPARQYATLNEWIAREAVAFSVNAQDSINSAVDKLIASCGDSVEVLGFGEALHGSEEILVLRNRLFQRLAKAHGYSAIAVESSFPRAPVVNDYVAGRGPASFDAVQERGFSHGFGRLVANRELVEWMRWYNADPSRRVELQFYGFDTPTEMMCTDSPRHVLYFVLDYFASIDEENERERRKRVDLLLGADAAWENPAAMMEPSKSIGSSADAMELRLEAEELITELHVRRPELIAKSDERRYLEAAHYARLAQWLLSYHAALARQSGDRIARCLGMRDAMMADNLAYIVSRERGRGKVLAFAHNSHLKRGIAQWQLGPELLTWWPAGTQLNEVFGAKYAVIGSAVGVSDANGIGQPEPGTLEAQLMTAPGPARFIPTHRGVGLSAVEIASLPTRSGSTKNPTYFGLSPRSMTDFDALAMLDSTNYNRGGPPLQ